MLSSMAATPPVSGPSGRLHALVGVGLARADHLGFWLEGPPAGPATRPTRARASRPTAPPHPDAAPGETVLAALAALLPAWESWQAAGAAALGQGTRIGEAALYLPSDGPQPLPSPGVAGPAWPSDGAAPRLRPWRAPVVWLPLERVAGPLWLAVEEAPGGRDTALALGVGTRWLGRVWALAARMWARGAVVPRVDTGRLGAAAAFWLPILDDPVLRTALEGLAQAMPVSLLAAVRPNEWSGRLETTRWACTVDMVSAGVDALARYTPLRTGTPRRPPAARERGRRLKRQSSAWGEVARTLGSASPLLYAGVSDPLRRVAQRLAEWQAPVDRRGPHLTRLAVRLAPPSGGGPWRIELTVASIGDRDRGVPLADALAGRGAQTLGLSAEELVRVARADLDRAATLVPWLAERRAGADGAAVVDLTAREALGFLRDAAPRLSAAGFAVALPAWWREDARRRLRVEVAAAPAERPARGALGLAALADLSWRASLDGQSLAVGDLLAAARGGGLVAVGDGWVEVSRRDARILERLLAAAPDLHGAMPASDLLALLADLGDVADEGADDAGALDVRAEGWFGQALQAMATGRPLDLDGPTPLPLGPDDLGGRLRPYQEAGVRWLWSVCGRGLGACLADDMGLGKTVQAIALVAARARAGLCGPAGRTVASGRRRRGAAGDGEGALPVLLVCPTSVLTNWSREFTRFAPHLRVHVRHGQARDRGEGAVGALAGYDVVITSYALVWRDHRVLGAMRWDGIVLDEAQAVKNPATRASRAVRRLHGRYRLALTGTPIENRLTDLWAIFQFLNPGYLGSAETFRRRFAQPVADGDGDAARVLRRLVAPLLLRRLKSDPTIVQDLPEKVEMRELCALTREQARLYARVVDEMVMRVAGLSGMARRGTVATAIIRLKQILNHPAHFLGERGPMRPERSGKVVRVHELVEEALSEGDRLLLFTQFVAFGDLIAPHLARLCGEEVPFLHGTLSRAERDRIVARFSDPSGPPILLASLRAGGVGLNLTRANRVIHLDRWWNPAVEAQATDRAHRIGQRERVMVHKMVVAGTIEERVDALLEDKRRLSEQIVGAGEGWLGELDDEALFDLVRLRAGEGIE